MRAFSSLFIIEIMNMHRESVFALRLVRCLFLSACCLRAHQPCRVLCGSRSSSLHGARRKEKNFCRVSTRVTEFYPVAIIVAVTEGPVREEQLLHDLCLLGAVTVEITQILTRAGFA